MEGFRLHRIVARFTHPRFAAIKLPIKTRNVALGEETYPLPEEKRPLIRDSFDEFSLPDSALSFSGSIDIYQEGCFLPSFPYESTRSVDVMNTPAGWVPVPTIRVRAELLLDSIPETILRTLEWYRKLASEVSAGGLESLLSALADGTFASESSLTKWTDQLDTFEYRMKLLGQLSDEKWQVFHRKIARNSPAAGYMKRALGVMAELFGPDLQDVTRNDREKADEGRKKLLEMEGEFAELIDPQYIRRRKYLRILGELERIEREEVTPPEGVSPEECREFAYALFELIANRWNRVVDYLKYNEYQHWVERYPTRFRELFYIDNEVTLDGEEIIPFATSHYLLAINRLESHYIDAEKWKRMIESFDNPAESSVTVEKSICNSLFSESLQRLSENELAAAVVIAGTGLENVLTYALWAYESEDSERTR